MEKLAKAIKICDKILNEVKKIVKNSDFKWKNYKEIKSFEKEIHNIADNIALKILENSPIKMNILTKGKDFKIKIIELHSNPDFFLVLDTIDGSINLVRRYPFYSFAYAILDNLYIESVVSSKVVNLSSGDEFFAIKGKGAFYNKMKIKAKGVKTLKNAIIGIDLYFENKNYNKKILKLIPKLLEYLSPKGDVRRIGSNAFEQCLVSTGAIDMFIDIRGTQSILEVIPSKLIVEESGGYVVNIFNKEIKGNIFKNEFTTAIFSANKKLLFQFFNLFKKYLR